MNIIIVSEYANITGGAEKVAIQSARGLAEAGHRITFFAASGPIDPSLVHPNIEVVCVRERYDVDDYGELNRVLKGTYDRVAGSKCKELLSRFDPKDTVVHFHSFRQQLTTSVLKAVFGTKFPVVYTCHDYGLACPYVGFYDYRREKICDKRGGSMDCLLTNCNRTSYSHKLWIFFKNGLLANLVGQRKNIDHFVFVSKFSQNVIESYLPSGSRLHVVQNPIEAVDEGMKALDPQPKFLFVGRITKEKDPETFALAAKKLGVTAVFVGDGNMTGKVRQANPDAILTGWQDSQTVRKHMRSARALVFPSAWYEGQPLTTQEALSVGLPSIISDVCAAQDVIEDGVTGLLFRCGDVDHLCAKMQELMDDERNTSLGREAYRRFWIDPPTMQKHITAIESVYREALA